MSIIFDGTDDCIGKDNISILNSSGFSATDYSFTVSCWVKPHGRHNGGIWEQYDGSNGAGRLGLYCLSNGKIRIRYHNSYQTSTSVVFSTDSDVWYHLVADFQYGSRNLYVDNSTAKSHTANKSSDHSTAGLDFKIGKAFQSSPGSAYYWDGEMTEWAAWDTVLTAGERTSLYNGASPLFVRPGNMRAYFPMGGPYVGSTATAAGAYRDVLNTYDLAETSSPTFAPTPRAFATGKGMYYPSAMGVLNNTVPYVAPGGGGVGGGSFSTSSSKGTYTESGISGGDVLHEIITSKLRWQGGTTVNNGGVSFFSTGNSPEMFIDGTSYVSILNNRLVEANRQDQEDEIHGGSKD